MKNKITMKNSTSSFNGASRKSNCLFSVAFVLGTAILLSFTNVIFAQTITIGTGTATTNGSAVDPIGDYYSSEHTQVLWTATELAGAGLPAGASINSLGFSVSQSPGALANYTIQMAHTTNATALTGYVTAGMSTVRTPFTYTPTVVAAGAFDMITFTSNFSWNGVDNIIIDFCTGSANPYATPYGGARYTTATDQTRARRIDGSSACAVAPNLTQNDRLNVRFDYTLPACLLPSGLTTSNMASTSATLNWSASASAPSGGYEWEVRTSGAGGSGATGLTTSGSVAAGVLTANVTGLTANTTYQYYVRSDCGAGGFSTWASGSFFTGYCVASGTSANTQITNVNMSGLTSLNNTSAANAGYANFTAVVPTVSQIAGGLVNFTLSYTSDPGTAIWVDWNNNLVFEPSERVFTSNAYVTGSTTGSFSVPALQALGSYRMRVVANCYSVYPIACSSAINGETEDYTFDVTLPPACSAPTALTAAAITAAGANLAWTAGATETTWEVVVQASGIGAPSGAGTAVTTTAAYSATGLTANTAYEIYYRANCGAGGFSTWAGPFAFTTLCTAVATFSENFDASTSIPDCFGGTSSGSYASVDVATASAYANSGSNSILLRTGISSEYAAIKGPELSTLGSAYRLTFSAYNRNSSATVLQVGTVSSSGVFTSIETVTVSGAYSSQDFIVDFNTYSGSDTRVMIKATYNAVSLANSNYTDMHIDDMVWEAIPSCLEPTAMTTSNLAATSVNLTWTASASAETAWEVVVQASGIGAPSGAGTAVTTTATYSATGLTANTAYEIYYRANCGAGGFSTWAGPISFTTPQVAATPPYTQDFSSGNGFTFINGTQTNKWVSGSATGNTGNSLYISNDNGVTNAYTNTSTSTTQVYRDIAIPSGTTLASLSFDWKAYGESSWDYLRVWLVPTTFIPTAGTQISAGTGRIQIGTNYGLQTTWQTYSNTVLDLSSFANATMRLVFEWKNDGSLGFQPPAAIDNISLSITNTWTGTTSTDWNTASNWTPASVPTSTDNIIIPSTGITNFPVALSLTIATGSTITLNANANLTVTGVLTNNGTITLSSGATLVQGASSTVAGSGTWNVNQAVVGSGITSSVTGRFYYMGSPVAASTTNALNPSAANRVWSYNESAAAFTEIIGNSTGLSVGQGYGTIFGVNQTINFTGGAINNGAINVSGLTKTGTSGTSGFNMVSNPYPSYLDWDAITKTNIEPTIWFQTKDGLNAKVFDIYSTTSGITISNSGTTVNQYIAPMQGYWTRVSTGTGSLAMTNSMRSHQSASSGLKTQATDFPIFVRLNLKSGQRNDQAVIFFDKNAANTKDAFDSEKMSVSGASQLYSVIENTKVAINGLNYTSGTAYSVPLTAVFNSDNEFSIEGTEVHVVSGMVYLEDKLMQTMSNLSNNASYTFMAAAGVVEDRFVLHFQPSNALSIDELTKDKITITADMSGNVSVVLNNLLSTEGVITVIDFAGRVLSTSVITQTSTKLKVTEAAGIYFVRVSNQNNIKTERIIISK